MLTKLYILVICSKENNNLLSDDFSYVGNSKHILIEKTWKFINSYIQMLLVHNIIHITNGGRNRSEPLDQGFSNCGMRIPHEFV